MDVYSGHRGWWGYHWAPPRPLSITQIIGSGSLDAELAALLWLLIEGRVPVLVAAEPPLAGKTTTLTALMDFLPPEVDKVFLDGWLEDFAWLPDAGALGWPGWEQAEGAHARAALAALDPDVVDRQALMRRRLLTQRADLDASHADRREYADPASSYLLVSELSSHLPVYTWGLHARVAVRALQRGYGMGASIHADSLEEVFEQLEAPPVSLSADEIRRMGVVIVLRLMGPRGQELQFPEGSMEAEIGPLQSWVRRRAVAVHYLRPLERDAAGHLQRRPPAVLATWDAASDCFEHFSWGIAPELAARVGRTQADFERLHAERTVFLKGLLEAGVQGVPQVRRALLDYRRRSVRPIPERES